jgi:transposase
MRAYSQEVRQQVLRAVDEGTSRAEIIERFQVSRAPIKRYLKQRRETGTVLPRPIPGRPSKKGAALQLGVQELLEAHPDASQQAYCQWWEAEHGMQVSRASMSRAIHALGWVQKKGRSTIRRCHREKAPVPAQVDQASLATQEVGAALTTLARSATA